MARPERLQKLLSRAGVASRRKAEELIRAGRVRVGGRVVTELGTRIDPEHDRVELDGKRLVAEPRAYIVLHKPRAVMCTMRDPEGRRTVADLVRGVGVRVVPVGRLDFHTSGVLLMTNDGDLAAALGHPRKGAPKTYVAKVRGVVDEAALARWRKSIEIDGRATRPACVRLLRVEGDKSFIEVTLREGRNRQVRRLGESAGFPVLRLVRSSFAGIGVEGLRPGEWRHLTVDELAELKRQFGVPTRIRGMEIVPGVHGRPVSRVLAGEGRRVGRARHAAGGPPRRDEVGPRRAGGGPPRRDEVRPRRAGGGPPRRDRVAPPRARGMRSQGGSPPRAEAPAEALSRSRRGPASGRGRG